MGAAEVTVLLVAGVGNLWRGDDGFGCEVARRLACDPRASHWVVRDFGIRAVDLFYALEGCEIAVVVDAVSRGAAPGTLFVLDPGADTPAAAIESVTPHASTAGDVLAWAAARRARGERPGILRLVGCEPETFGDDDEGCIGLSLPVERAVPRAVDAVLDLANALVGGGPCTSSE